jgi:predicted DNA-binding transcriptional regulator AlpA
MRGTKLLPPKDVSERLGGVPVATLYLWRHRGEGPPAMKIGRHLRYDEADLEAWIEARKAASR